MKKIFAILALFLAFSINMNAQSSDPFEAAKADLAELNKFIPVAKASQKGVTEAFYFKNKAKLQENLTAEQKQEITDRTEKMLSESLTEAQIQKLKANTKLYNKLVK